MNIEISVDDQRLLCDLVSSEIDNTNTEIREQSERGNIEDVKILGTFKDRLKTLLRQLEDKSPAPASKKDIPAIYKQLREHQNALDSDIQKTVHDILEGIPGKTVSLIQSHAYAYVEGDDHWFETPVVGVRINDKGYLEVSLESTFEDTPDEEINEVPDWNEDYVRDDQDNYSDINWLSVLNSLVYVLN